MDALDATVSTHIWHARSGQGDVLVSAPTPLRVRPSGLVQVWLVDYRSRLSSPYRWVHAKDLEPIMPTAPWAPLGEGTWHNSWQASGARRACGCALGREHLEEIST